MIMLRFSNLVHSRVLEGRRPQQAKVFMPNQLPPLQRIPIQGRHIRPRSSIRYFSRIHETAPHSSTILRTLLQSRHWRRPTSQPIPSSHTIPLTDIPGSLCTPPSRVLRLRGTDLSDSHHCWSTAIYPVVSSRAVDLDDTGAGRSAV